MAKKERIETSFDPEVREETVSPAAASEEEPKETLYESEAYGNPRPDTGTRTTVMKTVGVGGPVPIIAPKHNTIQLQPIIVPLAVVPYMSQDSAVLNTEGETTAYAGGSGAPSSSVEFDSARVASERRAVARRASMRCRLFSFVSFLLTALVAAGFMLAYFSPVLGAVDFSGCDVIGCIETLAEGGKPAVMSQTVTNIIAAFGVALALVATLIGALVGRYPRKTVIFSAALAMLAFGAELIAAAVRGGFDLGANAAHILMAALSALLLIVSAVLAAVANRREDEEEERAMRATSEI